MLDHEIQEILISPTYTALFIHLKTILLFLALTHTDDTGHVKVPGGEDTGPYIIVNGTLVHHNFIRMAGAYMVKRLAFHNEGADQGIQPQGLFFGKLNPLP